MTLTPLFDSPCDLAQRIPSMVSNFLDLENKVGRRFREDSVTDIVIASLLKIAGQNATVLVPPEVKTGGDFDILIVEPSTSEAIQYRIQAKRLSPNQTNWKWGNYRELDHPHGKGGQSSKLIRSSAKEKIETIPLYAFYNPESVCSASDGAINGIELADGREINQIVKALVKAKAKAKKPRYKRIEYLLGLFFPLSTILCPLVSGGESAATSIISPRISRAAVEAAIKARPRPGWMHFEQVPRLSQAPRDNIKKFPLPADDANRHLDRILRTTQFSPLVERAIKRRQDQDAIQIARVNRPKIILVSRNPDAS